MPSSYQILFDGQPADSDFYTSMASLEVVEINPVIDEHNRTALLGVELVLSGLGQKIL